MCASLLDVLPELLVELRPLPRPGHPAARLPLDHRLARRGDRRTARRSRRPVQALPLPHDHELHPDLPQGPEPGESHRRDQETAGRAHALSGRPDQRKAPPSRGAFPSERVGAVARRPASNTAPNPLPDLRSRRKAFIASIAPRDPRSENCAMVAPSRPVSPAKLEEARSSRNVKQRRIAGPGHLDRTGRRPAPCSTQ